MNNLKLVEYNKKISRFMNIYTTTGGYIFDKELGVKLINFDSSWDLLMTVFHKIGNLKLSKFENNFFGNRLYHYSFHYEILNNKCHIYYIRKGTFFEYEKCSIYYIGLENYEDDMITICFEAIVKFIDWYEYEFEN
jgi:hypothetical protein